MEYYLTIKNNKVLTHATVWVIYSCVAVFYVYQFDHKLQRPDTRSGFVYYYILVFNIGLRYLLNEVRNNIPKFLYNRIIWPFSESKQPRAGAMEDNGQFLQERRYRFTWSNLLHCKSWGPSRSINVMDQGLPMFSNLHFQSSPIYWAWAGLDNGARFLYLWTRRNSIRLDGKTAHHREHLACLISVPKIGTPE